MVVAVTLLVVTVVETLLSSSSSSSSSLLHHHLKGDDPANHRWARWQDKPRPGAGALLWRQCGRQQQTGGESSEQHGRAGHGCFCSGGHSTALWQCGFLFMMCLMDLCVHLFCNIISLFSHVHPPCPQNSRELITKWVVLNDIIQHDFKYSWVLCLNSVKIFEFNPFLASSTSSYFLPSTLSSEWSQPPAPVQLRHWNQVMRIWATTDLTSAGRRELWRA